ncbi:SPRY domain-containing SOCS box protein 3 [Fopius arisanus]|uniref:SPRY domain-containing SOCS box protein 3 n=1 Tax=Fopius arisanus TaxID=64838 RepID=A0A9R1SUA4_9HYME|nr:PREDICTED: SPRY domain-containing SOCS box protein 3-like [Fopius arisanus]
MNLDYDPSIQGFERFCRCSKACKCGQGTEHEWSWDEKLVTKTAELSEHNLEVKFHPGYSNGTAAVRGNRILDKDRHHYWEIKMLTPIYGTDVMVGVGTEKAQLDVWEKFCSLLGMTKDSWGFSYTGRIQHAGESRHYAMPFGQGSIVGVHLDTWRGTLQFFLNRRPLGIAFTGLRGLQLYPMVSSTAARSSVRITHSCSAPASLQMECLALLRPFQKRYLTVIFPGLKYLTQSILADVLSINRNDDEDEDEYEFPEEHLILDDFDFALVGYGRRKKKRRVIFPETESLEISP